MKSQLDSVLTFESLLFLTKAFPFSVVRFPLSEMESHAKGQSAQSFFVFLGCQCAKGSPHFVRTTIFLSDFSGSLPVIFFLTFFPGNFARCQGRNVSHMDYKEQQKRLAVSIACGDSAYSVMLLMIAEAAFHDSGAEIAEYTPGYVIVIGLILGFGTFSCEASSSKISVNSSSFVK